MHLSSKFGLVLVTIKHIGSSRAAVKCHESHQKSSYKSKYIGDIHFVSEATQLLQNYMVPGLKCRYYDQSMSKKSLNHN